MFPFSLLAALLGLLSAQAAGPGASIATQGTPAGVAPCGSCHGPEGNGNATFPAISGMNADYLEAQILAIRDGERAAPVMAPSVAKLTDEEAAQVAAWYASQARPAPRGTPTQAQLTLATPLIERGDWPGRDLPACTACHGEKLQGAGDSVPALAGQTPEYLAGQLSAFQSGARSDPGALMSGVGERLTADEISALSATIAAFDGGAQ